MNFKKEYTEIFNLLKKEKKLVFIILCIFSFSIVLSFFVPSLFLQYQENLRELINKFSFDFFNAFLFIAKNNITASLMGMIPFFSFLYAFFNSYITGTVLFSSLKTSEFGVIALLLKTLPHGMFEIPAQILSFFAGAYLTLGIIKKELRKRLVICFKLFFYLTLPLLLIGALIEASLVVNKEIFNVILKTENIGLIYATLNLYLFYAILKFMITYREKRNQNFLILSILTLIVLSDFWTRAHGNVAQTFFQEFQTILKIVPIAAFLIYLYFENQSYRARAEKEKIQSAFKQYVSPEVIEQITKDPSRLRLGGEKKNITIFFSDIRGFSTISEKLSPEKLVSLLNKYLSKMTDIVLESSGLVDKYIGDSIMAFWGAPVDLKEHEFIACNSALKMRKELNELNKSFEKEGFPEIKIGIGLNSGDVVVGNMGSEQRFNYTVMGDEVNLASRLEGLNKVYGTMIIVSENVYNKTKDKFNFREIDFVTVKGKTKPVKIYELSDFDKNLLDKFSLGLENYRKRKFKEAIKYFEECSKKYKDKASEVFIERCEEFIKKDPGKNWDGVFVMETK